MGNLDGKVAVVTGGGTGIGKAIVLELAARGAEVVAIGRRKEPLGELERAGNGRVAAFAADITRAGDAKRAIEFAVTRLSRLDILVNNAGSFLKKAFAETTDEQITQMLDVNVRGLLACCRESIPHLKDTKGAIVNISSASGIYARPNIVAYGASKAAVHQATRLMAVELGPDGIRVNAVAPGFTRTEMTDYLTSNEASTDALVKLTALGRVGEPEDVARVVAFLAGADARWVTGQIISASGGLLL